MATSNFHNLISLAEEGHMVYMTPSSKKPATEYFASLGIEIIPFDDMPHNNDELIKLIKDYSIDIVLLASPHWTHLRNPLEKHCEVIGLTVEAGNLEKNKLEMHKKVQELGLKVPRILSEDELKFPCVVKPIVAKPPIDHAQIYMDDYKWFELEEKRKIYDWYIEEFIRGVETNVAYCVSNGQWSIMHVQEIIGEDVAKLAGTYIHWTKTSSFDKLSPQHYEIAVQTAEIFLEGMVPQIGNASFIGQLTGLIDEKGEWYFCENNVRPETTNSLPFFLTGEEWLEGFTKDPSIIGNAFPQNVDKAILMPKEPQSPYPFHLHEKHGVAIPAGLSIEYGVYKICWEMRRRSPDEIIGLIVCDKTIPQAFLDDVEKDGNFFVKHHFIG
jgi:predicted ATP-grasp superfamily ATP-dependent carboligase